MYNFSLLNGTTNYVQVAAVANNFTDGLLGLFLLVCIGLAVFFGLKLYEPIKESLAATSFVVLICSILLRMIGLLDTLYVGASVILCIGAVIVLVNRE